MELNFATSDFRGKERRRRGKVPDFFWFSSTPGSAGKSVGYEFVLRVAARSGTKSSGEDGHRCVLWMPPAGPHGQDRNAPQGHVAPRFLAAPLFADEFALAVFRVAALLEREAVLDDFRVPVGGLERPAVFRVAVFRPSLLRGPDF